MVNVGKYISPMDPIWALYIFIVNPENLNVSAILGPGFPYFSPPLGVFPTGRSLVAINCPETLRGGAEVASRHFGLVKLREVSGGF